MGEETRMLNAALISDIIGKVISLPDQKVGQQVEIVGYYRGWDLLEAVKGRPPTTYNDLVIAYNGGVIYITENAPPNFNPASPHNIILSAPVANPSMSATTRATDIADFYYSSQDSAFLFEKFLSHWRKL